MRGLARRGWEWVRTHPSAVAILILAVLMVVSLEIDRQQSRNERRDEQIEDAEEAARVRSEQIELFTHEAERDCLVGNNTRRLFREIGVELSVAAVQGAGEGLIAVADDAPSDVVEEFRRATAEQARTRAEAVVAELPDVDCAEAMRAARAEIESRLDGE